ncbi:T9SS type A sorting domain-containing protein [Ichthyenterobacterium sp. W332]|uniref:T9SS type A sorting domain-containing protein n=1 Tax=Microcosmobacter mediterraneus TaxID=3075607 RepID=A0ABU2YQ45_9FLAO|nr:T9SS type A sorting domain-containing protein [Ichthyenterobacterium sp. W332]MDT0559390.1 T9SS type A sorting domain-containing protein [Ichthyenterobacterium sp. W332]
MKKVYFLLLLLLTFSLGYSQSVIVTVDRANIVGPTDTGNDPSITSSGLVRGSGVDLAAPGAANFTANQWQATTQAEAVTNNEYIEWSVSASAANSVEVTEIDIRNRRNGNGPTNWQIFYSFDNFATSGSAATTVQTSAATATNYTFSGLSIDSGTAGTITFRLYAWSSLTNGGWFRIATNGSWSDFGIASPGVRLTGNITTTAPNDLESNIITTSFDPSDNIDYTLYNVTSGLTIANAIKIGEFNIQDGGDDLTDSDGVSTILTDISFNISAFDNLAAIALFDGTTNVGETATISDTVSVNALNGGTGIEALDDSIKTFDVYATFNNSVTDNDQIELTINSATADVASGSGFEFFDAGGAITPTLGDDNRIEVTASALAFNQQPVDGNQFEVMTPFPIVFTVDVNDNQDLDATGTVTILAAGSLVGAPIDYPIVGGVSTLNTLVFDEQETAISLFALGSGALGFTISNTFDINGPLINIVCQDFDGASPEWTYTNDIPFFDNGWGTDGYYGLIDISSASPLDYENFSGNILGENDLNDEGDNGTTGFAEITFATIDISNYENVKLSFDWDIDGYVNNNNDAQYRLILDGVNQPRVFLLDGNGAIDSDEGTLSLDIPEGTNTVALEIRVRNNRLLGFSGFDNFKLTSTFDGLLYTANSWSPNAPSGATENDNALILDGSYIVGSNIEVNNLYIEPGATTSVALGQSITANGGVVNRGTLEMNSASSSYSSLISTNTVQGEVIYDRHVNQFADTGSTTGNNDLISAPVTSAAQDFLALRTANPNLPSGTIGGTLSYLFGPFDNDIDDYVIWTGANDSDPIESGKGYRTASTDVSGSTFTFTGNVTIAQSPVSINVGIGSIFNLIGNPYPSYITLSGFLAANNSEFDPLFSGVYGYDGDATDGFQIWNQAYSDANPNALIAPGQGFLVSSQAGGGSISFPASIRSIGTADDFIAGRLSNPNIAHIKLKLSSDTKQYFTDIYFNDNASLGLDYGYDSAIYNNSTPDFAIYSQLVENNNGIDLGVQSVDYTSLENVIIPLGINASQGEQITIETDQLNIPEGVNIYLEDTLNNTFTLLTESNYTYTPQTNLNDTGRFFLRTEQDALSITENDINSLQVYNSNTPKELVIKGNLSSNSTLELYDMQGRLVMSKDLDTTLNSQTIDMTIINTGIYVVNIKNEDQKRAIKIIVE